jgi:hypothetical protein
LLGSACGLSQIGTSDAPADEASADGGAIEEGSAAADGVAAMRDAAAVGDAHGDAAPGANDGAVSAADAAGADASVLDAPDGTDASIPEVISFVQAGHQSKSSTQSSSTTIAATKSGSFIAVMATYYGVTPTITGVTDNATGGSNTYVSANLRSVVGTCQASEIWYARSSKPGATSVTVTTSGSVTLLTWVVEFSGLRATGGVDVGLIGNNASGTTTVTAPAVTPSAAPAAVLSVVGSCGALGSIKSPFTAISNQSGDDAAYYIAPSVAAWGPIFNNSNDGWNGSTAAFR